MCSIRIVVAMVIIKCTSRVYVAMTTRTVTMLPQVLCAAAVNPATFIEDYSSAVPVKRQNSSSPDTSISLVWVCTSLPSLTKVTILLDVLY